MPTPADIPAKRLPAPQPAKAARNRRRRRNCANYNCHHAVNLPRFACSRHWNQLPEELKELLRNTPRPGADQQPLPHDHPYRVLARLAHTVWGDMP